jgi:hypothetical protein
METELKTPRSSDDPFLVVMESEIDLLLLEELRVSAAFRSWFVEEISAHELGCEALVGVWRSVITGLGESDLVLIFRPVGMDSAFALLIENKILAEFQERQAERYRERGEEGRQQRWWTDFRTCLVAPQRYLSSAKDAGFDLRLSYEAIIRWFEQPPEDARRSFKAAAFRDAIERSAGQWQRIVDPVVTQFFQQYEGLCMSSFPRLALKGKPERSVQDTWIYFHRSEGVPKSLYMIHKCDRGYVDLTFQYWSQSALAIACAEKLEPNMLVVQTGKSAAIRIVVPKLECSKSFGDQAANVVATLTAAEQLRAFAARHAEGLIRTPVSSKP